MKLADKLRTADFAHFVAGWNNGGRDALAAAIEERHTRGYGFIYVAVYTHTAWLQVQAWARDNGFEVRDSSSGLGARKIMICWGFGPVVDEKATVDVSSDGTVGSC